MSGSEHARPVWLTRAQRDLIVRFATALHPHVDVTLLDDIATAWLAAPTDPVQAIGKAVSDENGNAWKHRDGPTTGATYAMPRERQLDYGHAVLRALGCAKDPA